MIYFLLLTALTVSIDSFACGFSLAFNKGKKYPIVLGIALTVLVMCLLTNYLTKLFADYLSEKIACLGGLILIAVGIYNLFKKDSDGECNENRSPLKQSLITGFAVGLDGAFANLSLSLMGINAFYVPLTIAVMHAVMIALGILLAKAPFIRTLGRLNFIPPLILIALGSYKLLGLFI